jgi:branched-chain amino acid transport system permease protein
MGGVASFMRWTKLGRAMRASASDPEAAALQGISAITVSRLAMVIGFGVAAVGGGIMGPIYGVELGAAMGYIIKGIVAIVIGGPGSLGGCLAAAFILGMTESFCTTYANPQLGYIVGFLLLIAVILVRPWGLFGRPIRGF